MLPLINCILPHHAPHPLEFDKQINLIVTTHVMRNTEYIRGTVLHNLCCFFCWRFLQVYNMCPWLVSWIKNRQQMLSNRDKTVKDVKDLIKHLKETLNPNMCRGLVDCFLIRQQKEEVRLLIFCVSQLRHQQQCCTLSILLYVIVLSRRNLLSSMKWTWYTQWPTCLELVLTLQQRHWDGVCCSWPKILIYRVRWERRLVHLWFPLSSCTTVILTCGIHRNVSTAFGLPRLYLLTFALKIDQWPMWWHK